MGRVTIVLFWRLSIIFYFETFFNFAFTIQNVLLNNITVLRESITLNRRAQI